MIMSCGWQAPGGEREASSVILVPRGVREEPSLVKAVQLLASNFLPDLVRPLESARNPANGHFPSTLNRPQSQVAAALGSHRPFGDRVSRASGQAVRVAWLDSAEGRGGGCSPRSSQSGEGCSERVLICGHHPHLPALLQQANICCAGGGGGGKCSRDPGWEGFLEEEIVAGCFVHFVSHRASLVITWSLRGGALCWYGVSASLPLGFSHVVLLSAAPSRRFPRPLEGYSSICHLLA